MDTVFLPGRRLLKLYRWHSSELILQAKTFIMTVRGEKIMAKAVQDLTFKQIENAVNRLDTKSKMKLIEKMIPRQTRKERWGPLVERIRQNFAQNPISDEEIRAICEEVREELYDEEKRQLENKKDKGYR